jgi:hypothetical protein
MLVAASAAGLRRLGRVHGRGPRKLTLVAPKVPVARTPGTSAMTMQRRSTSLRCWCWCWCWCWYGSSGASDPKLGLLI